MQYWSFALQKNGELFQMDTQLQRVSIGQVSNEHVKIPKQRRVWNDARHIKQGEYVFSFTLTRVFSYFNTCHIHDWFFDKYQVYSAEPISLDTSVLYTFIARVTHWV